MGDGTFEITCPCCGALLSLDVATGALLSHTAPRKELHSSFEEAAGELKAARKRAESKFEKALEESSHQSDILEKKFRKALEKAAEDDAPPGRPFDRD